MSYRVNQHPGIFQNRTRIEVMAAHRERATRPRVSWWTAHADPNAPREQFTSAMRQRHLEREQQTNAAQWRALVGARKSAGMQS